MTKSPTNPTRLEHAWSSTGHEDVYQVVLHNDNVNHCEYVVACLVQIFRHPVVLAEKIMVEAHLRGRAIAEVESESQARQHATALTRAGLIATVEKV